MDEFEDNADDQVAGLISRTALLAPARDVAPLTPEELSVLASAAKGWQDPMRGRTRPPAEINRSRRRWGYASVVALVGAGALAAAVLVSVGSSTPTSSATGAFPGSKLHLPSRVLKLEPILPGMGTAYSYTYDFTVDPMLSTATGSGTGYELTSPIDVAAVTAKMATALGLSGGVTNIGPGNYNGGVAPGPSVTTLVQAGVLSWLYPTWGGNVHQYPSLGEPQSIPVDPDAPLPTDAQATADAQQLFLSMGVDGTQMGAPQVSRYPAAVDVYYPIVVDGLPTDQEESVAYGNGATVISTSGVIFSATPSATYPTISPAQAACNLPTNSNDATPTDGASCNTGATEPDVVSVDVNAAAPALDRYVLANGASWLLPTWTLSGPETGSMVRAGSTYSGPALAVSGQYVQPVSSPLRN
jgi:hypothetical protein